MSTPCRCWLDSDIDRLNTLNTTNPPPEQSASMLIQTELSWTPPNTHIKSPSVLPSFSVSLSLSLSLSLFLSLASLMYLFWLIDLVSLVNLGQRVPGANVGTGRHLTNQHNGIYYECAHNTALFASPASDRSLHYLGEDNNLFIIYSLLMAKKRIKVFRRFWLNLTLFPHPPVFSLYVFKTFMFL